MFNQNIFKKKPAYCSLRHINISNSIESGKRKHLQGEIYLVHCRGHNCIMLIFYFKGFYDKCIHRCLEIITAGKKNGVLFFIERA